MSSAETPPGPSPQEQAPSTTVDAGTSTSVSGQLAIPSSGRRQAFRDIRRQLQEAELANPGVQKLLLEDLERAEGECEILQGYVERFHDADKRAAIAEEKLKSQTGFEVLYSSSLGLGCAIVGLAPFFWDEKNSRGPAALVVGLLLVICAALAKIVKR
jgi:hypothetical protein